MGSIPGQGAKIPHALRPKSQNIEQKQYCNKFNKDFKNGPHQKHKKIIRSCCCCCCCIASVVSNSAQPHSWLPTRLPCPWDYPGKDTGVGCHFLPQCMKVKRESEVAQSCLTLSDPMDCSLPGSAAHEIFQARVLEWGAIAFSEYAV